ncbi:MAG: alpha/beta hydrolase family protein [Kofleriaceae bacterium]
MKFSAVSLVLALGVSLCSCSRSASPGAGASLSPSRVITERWSSESLGVDKRVVIYLPRGYDSQPARRYPVFYYLHGLGGDESNWVDGGKLDQVADELQLEAIVVMPDGDDDFYIDSPQPSDLEACLASGQGLYGAGHSDPATTCVRRRFYETYIASDLLRWIDARYRTIAAREGRGIAGLSMGGFGAMALALRHPDLFSAAASHSGAVAQLYEGPRPFVPGRVRQATALPIAQLQRSVIGAWLLRVFGDELEGWRKYDVVALAEHLKPGELALYFDCGTEDGFQLDDNLRYVDEVLTARQLEHEVFLGPGRHDFGFWRERLPHSLAFLRAHVARAR